MLTYLYRMSLSGMSGSSRRILSLFRIYIRMFGQIWMEFEVGGDSHCVVNDSLVPDEGREDGSDTLGHRWA